MGRHVSLRLVIGLGLVALALLGWVSVASARVLIDTEGYTISTPAPEGQASCTVLVSATKDAGIEAVLQVGVETFSGEAQIAELGIGSGTQPGCDIYPDRPHRTLIPLDINAEVFFFEWTLEVHAHQDADCTAPGLAEGQITLLLGSGYNPQPLDLDVTLLCD